jgi:phosphoribosylaminoimidazolecarboxamide formyltransferase/IMP cyclohydrolase
MPKIKRALLSVSDKTGVVEFARGLRELGVTLLSTGGTAKAIADAGLPVTQVSDYTGFPEMMDGRVKTLHPKIHGALLALRDNPEHMAAAKQHGIELIDMVVVNLYPFQQTVAKPGVTLEEAIENIDIGGPSMLRSAAKNHRSVAVICNPARYADLLAEMKRGGGELSAETLSSLAVEAYAHTAAYDTAITNYLRSRLGRETSPLSLPEGEGGVRVRRSANEGPFPAALALRWEKVQDLRYGENPHQKAAFYRDASGAPVGLAAAKQLHGKELSFNNFLDLEAVLLPAREFAAPAAIVVKHLSPCGIATAETLVAAYGDALMCDPLSAFGGIVGLNRKLDANTARAILDGIATYGFLEAILAPGYDADALEMLRAKKDLRLLELPDLAAADAFDFKRVTGGAVVQDLDTATEPAEWNVVTRAKPTAEQTASLKFAWQAVKYVKSNAILIAQGTKAVGIGGGVTSRVDATWLAVRKSEGRGKGGVLASDAFFPKSDAVQVAAEAGIAAIIQPGGSRGDEEAIAMCNQHGIAMVFTGQRHFRH